MTTPQHQNSSCRGHEIYKVGSPFLGHHYCKLSLSALCLGGEKKIFKRNNAFSLHDLYDHTLAQETLDPGIMNVTILVDPSLVIITIIILSLSDLCLGVEKQIFTKLMHFHHMTYMATPKHKNPCAGGHEITILVDPSLVIITIYLVCLIYAWE